MGKYTKSFNNKLTLTDRHYSREAYQSYMTAVEWRNVEMSKELAKWLGKGRSLFKFPYFSQIADLWKIFYQSYLAARKHDRAIDILRSEYMMMDIFISMVTTLELAPKGLMSLLLRPFLQEKNATSFQEDLAKHYVDYAKDLETIPFYDHQHQNKRKELAHSYLRSSDKTWTDWLTWKFISAELRARSWVSKPLHKWFSQEGNQTEVTTDMIVKFRAQDVSDSKQAQEQFLSHLQNTDASIVNNHVYVKEKNPGKNYTSVYALLRASRYGAFQETVQALEQENIHIQKIAGQDTIQVKGIINEEKKFPNTHAQLLYEYEDRIRPNRRVGLFDVPVKNLQNTLNDLHEQGVKVKFIHNF